MTLELDATTIEETAATESAQVDSIDFFLDDKEFMETFNEGVVNTGKPFPSIEALNGSANYFNKVNSDWIFNLAKRLEG